MEHTAKEGRESDPIRPLRCISPKPESPAHYEWKCRLVSPCNPSRLVSITDLHAEPRYGGVLLHWTTSSYHPDLVFEIEQQQPDGSFSRIGNAHLDATTGRFLVEGLAAGTYTFRLKQTAGPLDFAYSEHVTATLLPEGLTIGAPFPSPFNQQATLEFASGTDQKVVVEVFDVAGRLLRTLYSATPPAHQTVTLSIEGDGLGTGLLLVRFAAGGSVVGTRTLMYVR